MIRKVIPVLLILIIILSFAQSTKVEAGKDSKLTKALKDHLHPIKTVEAGNGFNDLRPLKEYLRDKKIIALGEATHGSREFFQMKHRIRV